MCGLLITNAPGFSDARFKGALDLQKHRGPDAEEIHNFGNVKLGHKRLKILDVDDRSIRGLWWIAVYKHFHQKTDSFAIQNVSRYWNFAKTIRRIR